MRAAVWLVDASTLADAQCAGMLGWLGAGELARYHGFTRRERQRQFLIGRVLARQALGHLLGVAPHSIVIDGAAGQKPVLASPHAGTGFSISHSGPWVACAVSDGGEVGLDIERIDPRRDILALAEQALSDAQCQWLAARPEASRTRDFFTLWCAEEAQIKLGSKGQCMFLLHEAVAVALCGAHPFASRPELRLLDICEIAGR